MRLGLPTHRRVLFSANNGVNVVMYRSIAEGLKADSRVKQFHTAYLGRHRRHDTHGRETPRSFFAAHGIRTGVIPNRVARYLPLDLYVSPNFSTRLFPHFATRTIQIFHGVSFKNYSVKDKVLRFDRLFLPGPYHRRKFIESGLCREGDQRLKMIGLPKLDRLVNGSLNRTAILEELRLDPALRTVLYAPTGDAGNSLFRQGEQIIRELGKLPVNLIVKPHDHADADRDCSIDWHRRLREMSQQRFAAVFHSDVVPLLEAADLLVSDASSVAFEYTLLDRPIIFIDVPEILSGPKSQRFDLSTWGRKGGDIVRDPIELLELVPRLLDDSSEKRGLRKRIARDLFFDPGGATERAVRCLYADMELEYRSPEQPDDSALDGRSDRPAETSPPAAVRLHAGAGQPTAEAPPRKRLLPIALSAVLAAALVTAILFSFLRDPSAVDVRAAAETVDGGSSCQVAGDPAIWVHPTEPELSRIIGADTTGGLALYDLSGTMVQCLSTGRITGVDLRQNIEWRSRSITLLVGGEEEHEQLILFALDTETQQLEEIPDARFNIGVDPEDVCLYRSRSDGELYAFVSGEGLEEKRRYWVEQYRIFERPTIPFGVSLVRRIELATQPESLVADDELGHIYVAEERVGIWKYGADPGSGEGRTRVDHRGFTGGIFGAVDGLALLRSGEEAGFLIAASDRSDDFVVYRRQGQNEIVGRFEIVRADGIDAVAQSRGIAVVSAAVGSDYAEGLFVSQDDDDDQEASNYKLVSWSSILASIVSQP